MRISVFAAVPLELYTKQLEVSLPSKVSKSALPILGALGVFFLAVFPIPYNTFLLGASLIAAAIFCEPPHEEPVTLPKLKALFFPANPCRLAIHLLNRDHLPQDAPRGIKDEGGCGWLNADLQLLESSTALNQWLTESPPQELASFRDFFLAYSEKGQRLSSRPILSALIHLFPWVESGMDPFDLLAYILDLCPQDMKGKYRKSVHYHIRMSPAIKDFEVKDNEISIVSLTIRGSNPHLEKMLDTFYNERPIGLKRTEVGSDGKIRIYRANRIERRFLSAPPELWFHIARFENVVQKSIFNEVPLLKSIFPPIDVGVSKNSAPVSIPQEIEINPLSGPSKTYRLNAFLVHEGAFPQENRVKAYRFKDTVLYGCHNDRVVKISHPAQQEILSQAYLLHYEPV